MDEQVVGAGASTASQSIEDQLGTSTADQADNSGPLEDRLVSKNWSVRAKAFDELVQNFKGAQSQKDDIFNQHASMWKKYLGDTNPGALEKCLDSLTAFIDRGDPRVVAVAQNDIVKGLVEKCIGHAKPTIKHKGLECFNLLFEVTENFEESIETMVEVLQAKNIKVSTAALVTLNSWVSNYGSKKVSLKPFMKLVEGHANSSNPGVRSEAMNFYKECYKWLGEGLKSLISDLKKQQLDDLEKAFEELKDQPKKMRPTRSEQKASKNAAIDASIKAEEEEKSMQNAAYELADAADILSKYGPEWQSSVAEMTKWTDKKAQLESLINDASVPKLMTGDYSDLIILLKKLVGDSNPVVSQMSIKVCGLLSKGLRKDFGEDNCRELAPVLVQKFKEKKTQTIEEVHGVLDSFQECANLEVICQAVVDGIVEKAPSVKKNVCLFLEKILLVTYIDVLQRVSDQIIPPLVKNSDDSAADVRDAALNVLGILKGRLGESAMSKYLQDLNPQKQAKVNEASAKVQPSKYDRPEKVVPKAPPAPKGKKPAEKKAPAKKKDLEEEKIQPQAQEEEMIKASSMNQPDVEMRDEDERPLGGKGAYPDFNDEPIGGGNKNEIDEIPVGGSNKNNFDEMPIGGSKNNFDDMPIGGGNPTDEKPIGGGGRSGYNLDDLDNMAGAFADPNALIVDMGPPKKKRAPPARFAQKKAEPEEKKEEDPKEEEKKDEELVQDNFGSPSKEEPVKAKPPPKPKPSQKDATKTAAPKAAAAGKGGASAPAIQDEDVGQGLSKEEAEAKVQEVFSEESVANLEEAKWQAKVEGMKQFGEQVVELQPSQDAIEALVKFIKSKMKDWKESNVNIIKEAIALFTVIAQSLEKINKRAVHTMMPFLSDKLGDVKVTTAVQELLFALSEQVSPKYVGLQIVKYASTAKSPNILKESCNMLNFLNEDFGIAQMPIKEMIGYGTTALNHSNAQVRTAATGMFVSLFKQGGDMIKNFLTDVKESTMKVLEDEFGKTTPYKKGEHQPKRFFKGAKEEQMAMNAGGKSKGGAAAGGGGLDDMLPREDISKQISSKLVANFKNNDWKVRKEAAEQVEELLRGAKMRIKPDGLNELIDNMKQRMSDPNKSVLKSYIQLIALLVEALGAAAKQFSKKLLPSILQNLADKQSLVRNDALTCADKWADVIGPETVINYLIPLLAQENPEMRQEGMNWIKKHNEAISKGDVKEFVKPLVACLSDKSPAIRQLAESIIEEVMPITGYQSFQAVLKDLKPAVQNAIKPILEKVKNKVGAKDTGADPNNGSIGLQNKGTPSAAQGKNEEPKEKPGAKPATTRAKGFAAAGSMTATNKDAEDKEPKSTFAAAARSKVQSTSKQRSESKEPTKKTGLGDSLKQTAQQQQPEPAQEVLNIAFGYKEKRADLDRRNKWQTEEIKGDQVEKLKNQVVQIMGQGICQKMFSNDFKHNNESVDILHGVIQGEQPEAITEVLDIIFKWAQVRIGESQNTQFMIKIFDFYAILFSALTEMGYQIQDFEAAVLMPFLCDKSGINNKVLQDKVKKLIKLVYGIYEQKKAYGSLIQFGLNSKNSKSQAECLNELEYFIKTYGIEHTVEKDLKIIAKLADSGDKAIRENAVTVMAEVYKIIDNDIWRIIGQVTPKVQGLFEQRFKKVKGGPGLGLGGSASSTNLFQPDNNLGSERSPNRAPAKPSGIGQGLIKKNTQNMIDNQKKTITPRNALQFNKDKPPANFGQAQANQSTANLSKSINQFNSSNKSTGSGLPQPQLNVTQSQHQGIASKQSMFAQKKFGSTDSNEIQSFQGVKKPIPQTTRPDLGNSNRMSGNDPQNIPSGIAKQHSANAPEEQFDNIEDLNVDQDMILNLKDVNVDQDMESTEEIMRHIQQLKHGDLSKRVDSLVSLNEMISQVEANKDALGKTSNELVNAFTHVLIDIFERPVDDIPLRFAKYFITIVLKACSCKEIMKEASEECIFELAEQLLIRLLIDGLDKIGENREGELILKNLNSSMLRLLENCNHTYIFCVLFNLLRKYKDYHRLPKLPGLIIKCLLKLSKILEKLIDRLDMQKILLAIHEYLATIDHDNKTQNDEMGIRIVKTVTNEIVKLKRESIWEDYKIIQDHSSTDHHIYRWIQIILRSLNGNQTSGNEMTSNLLTTPESSTKSSQLPDQELQSIIEELRHPEMFEAAIPKLYTFLEKNPQMDLNEFLQDCSKTFQDFIKKNLERYRNSQKEEQKEGDGLIKSMQSTNHSDNSKGNQDQDMKSGALSTSNRVIEYQSKLQGIKQRYNQKTGENTATNKEVAQQEPPKQPSLEKNTSQPQQQNLNTSFSDMNNRLTQKWKNQINKKNNISHKDNTHMSNTMGGFGGPTSLEQANLPMNQSSGMQEDQQNMQAASNSDLNKRLAEMKAKLQALKKK